jgi:hypothetical protein
MLMALRIRALRHADVERVREIHNNHFPDLIFPRFESLLSAFVIEDENDSIVMAGGVEPIAEALLVTNKTMSRIKIGKALVEAQRFALFTCGKFNIRELHAFTTDDEYAKHLIQHGFHKREETVLRMIV